mgnify:CR=1 FL=1
MPKLMHKVNHEKTQQVHEMHTFQVYLFVAMGGAVGASMRYLIVQISTNLLGKGFPFGVCLISVWLALLIFKG